jgi:hypothetical protein
MTARYLKANLDTGSATAASSIIPIADGGTGASTQQDAINALTGTQSSGKYLRSDGTNSTLSDIQASDVPTLNQNTTGTAANLSGTPDLPNGTTATTQSAGDNSTKLATTAYADTSAQNAVEDYNPMTTLGDTIYGGTSGAPQRLAGNTTSTKNFLSSLGSAGAATAPAWETVDYTDIQGQQDASAIASGIVSNTEFEYLNGVTSSIQSQLDAKLDDSQLGSANGVAELDADSRLPADQLTILNIQAGSVSSGSFSGTPKTATVTMPSAMPSTNYSVSFTGTTDARIWTVESKTTTGFVVNSNSNQAITGSVDWIVVNHGDL